MHMNEYEDDEVDSTADFIQHKVWNEPFIELDKHGHQNPHSTTVIKFVASIATRRKVETRLREWRQKRGTPFLPSKHG